MAHVDAFVLRAGNPMLWTLWRSASRLPSEVGEAEPSLADSKPPTYPASPGTREQQWSRRLQRKQDTRMEGGRVPDL